MGCCRSQTQAVQYVDDPTSALLKKRAESPRALDAERRMHQTEHISNLQVNTPQPNESAYANTPLAKEALALSAVDDGLAASPLRETGLGPQSAEKEPQTRLSAP